MRSFRPALSSGSRSHCKKPVYVCLPRLLPFILAVLGLLVGQLFGQQVKRDQQALIIVGQALQAAGSPSVLSAVQDFTESGTITYYWDDQVSGDVTLKGRGPSQLRIDATLPDGVRTVVLTNGSGSVRESDGTLKLVPHERAMNPCGMTFPYLPLLDALLDPSISVKYMGLVNPDGNQVYKIRVQPTFSSTNDPTGHLSNLASIDFLIDPGSLLIVGTLVPLSSGPNGERSTHFKVAWSDYRTIDGIAIPMSIKETLRGQTVLSMQLNRVKFNTGLTDSTFAPQ